jgi:hypothetical protein
MQLTPEDISSFADAWEADFGERLSLDVADSEAQRLIAFFLSLAEARLDDAGNAAAGHDTMLS